MQLFQPIDIPSLVRAVTWLLIAILVLTLFRRPLNDLVLTFGQRVRKFSFGGLSLELAVVSEMKPPVSLETEIRELGAALYPQSGSTAIADLLKQLQSWREQGYIVIDLGSESSPRWLTSRLYLLVFLITLLNRPLCIVFVETAGGIRKRFIGTASPDSVRWALARRYSWLESASASAYGSLGDIQIDPATGSLSEGQTAQLIQSFLAKVRPGTVPPAGDPEWIALPPGIQAYPTYEHSKWLDGSRLERLLGSDLSCSQVVILPNHAVNEVTDVVLSRTGRFVALTDPDKTFRGLVDRSTALEKVANEFLREVRSKES